MKHILKNNSALIFASVFFVQSVIVWAADDRNPIQPPSPVQVPPNLTEEQRKVTDALSEAKKKVDALMQERNDLIQKGATPQEVQAKSAQIMQTQRDAIESLRKSFPQGLPPIPGMNMAPPGPPKLSPSEQAELDSLIAQRKQMVMNGAKFEDVQSLTDKIQEKYYGRKMTLPPIPQPPQLPPINQNPIRMPSKPAESKTT